MLTLNKGILLILGSCLLNGCDSSYHLFDGLSGYKFATITPDRFSIQYYGNEKSSLSDVNAMWHHKARELCKGGAYEHNLLPVEQRENTDKQGIDASFLPKDNNYLLKGEVTCLAPTYTAKTQPEHNALLSNRSTH